MKGRRNILFTIGIDKYESGAWKDLSNAALDAKELVRILVEKYSFEVYPDSLFNEMATKKNIFDSLNTLKNVVEAEDNLIIFYAGHGNMNPYTHRGYWIPYEGTSDLHTWIENSVIKDFIHDLKTKHTFLIADSCFSGTFLTRTRDKIEEKSYESLDQKKSRWMLASGSEEKVSDGVPGQHSPFCKYLFRYLLANSNEYTSVSEIIKYVETLTKNNSTQSPMGAFIDNIGHENGEMVLSLKKEFVKHNFKLSRSTPNTPELRLELASNQQEQNKMSAGKEILLVKSFVEGIDFLICENFRFDDSGNKKLKFKGSKIILKAKGKEEQLELVQRFATWQGITRYLDSHEEYHKSVKTVVINAHEDIEKVEEQPFSLSHADYLKELFSFNKDTMSCLHCGDKISTNDGFLVEVDELELKNNVGNVHKECLRPADRILGQSGYKDLGDSNLINFNFSQWLDLLEKGQGQLKGLGSKIGDTKIAIISWNPENNRNEGNYCIKINYDNGSSFFMKLGKEIHRFKKEEIDKELDFFNQQLKLDTAQGDPPCRIVENGTFGSYKALTRLKAPGQTITKVNHYEKELYTKQFEENKEELENDYAPLGLVRYAGTDDFVKIGNVIPLLSKPEEFEPFYKNWKAIVENIDKCTLRIISSDFELDSYLQFFFTENVQPIIDPLFNLETKKLESGFLIKDFRELVKEAEAKSKGSEVKWKKDDLVQVVFPGIKTDKFATGVLLTDEFIDEIGESCVIFQAVENGTKPANLKFKMPTKLLQRLKK